MRIEEARRTQAESLDLGDLALSELPASLGDLPHLKKLCLGIFGPNDGQTLPEFTDLAPLAGLHGLQGLDLCGCAGVSDLSPLAGLQELQSLDLVFCDHITVPSLRVLANHPSLTELFASEVAGVPEEVFSHNSSDNCLPRLRSYFSELGLGAEAENEVKVILLGNSHVGKTQLCRRFRSQSFDESVQSTHGVQIWRGELRSRAGDQEQTFQVNWWDFGGQDIYHGTHALFRLVREFAHHVDDILVFLQDVLIPRKLEAHLDDGFQSVREALRSRMG